jgi:Ca2+-binding RTX toxin-like protein
VTGRVRIPADVDREDRLLAGLSARQLAILGTAAVVLWVAYAATKLCDDPVCNGTDGRDVLIGTKIDNVIYGYGAKDIIRDTAGPDQDTVYGGSGKDVIDVREGNNNPRNADYVDCGDSKDTVYYDEGVDTVVRCELKNPTS